MKSFDLAKNVINKIPFVGNLACRIYILLLSKKFSGSEKYWKERYKKGGNSGNGSYNQLAEFKAEITNHFVNKHNLESVIEFGCGDGNQLKLATYSNYIGLDVSSLAINNCRKIFSNDNSKVFKEMDEYNGEEADISLSLDVIYHLVEDTVFNEYMRLLFDASERFVIIYSSNKDKQEKIQSPHVKHRKFSDWVEINKPNWQLLKFIPNKYPYIDEVTEGSFADFYIYKKV